MVKVWNKTANNDKGWASGPLIVLFVDNLFFYSGGQLVSCKASLAALRSYGFLWYCYDDVLSENKYDDDDDRTSHRDRILYC